MSDMNVKDRAYFWLQLADNASVGKKRRLIEYVGGIESLYNGFPDHAKEVIDTLGESGFAKLSIARDDNYIDKKIEELRKAGVAIVSEESENYPPLLRDISDAPIAIFAKGNLNALKSTDTLGVVGSRTPSRYGKSVTENFVREIVHADITIVSGLARGIDTVAHRSAIGEDKVTVAVVANGLDRCYPPENHSLMDSICSNGAVISEYPLGAIPYPHRFPERNRIISGMSRGILITEAGRKSGSLITLRYAVEENRNVYIVPGNVDSPKSAGSNEALRELQGAMVTEPNHILADYGVKERDARVPQMKLDVLEEKIVEFVKGEDRHFDEIIEFSGIGVSSLVALLSKLELLGLIKKLSGNYYGK